MTVPYSSPEELALLDKPLSSTYSRPIEPDALLFSLEMSTSKALWHPASQMENIRFVIFLAMLGTVIGLAWLSEAWTTWSMLLRSSKSQPPNITP